MTRHLNQIMSWLLSFCRAVVFYRLHVCCILDIFSYIVTYSNILKLMLLMKEQKFSTKWLFRLLCTSIILSLRLTFFTVLQFAVIFLYVFV